MAGEPKAVARPAAPASPAPAPPAAAAPRPAPALPPRDATPATLVPPPAPRPAALRDDPASAHPLVREASRLFDATIVRVELAGSLPAGTAPAPDATADPDLGEPAPHGDPDV
jgi:hypothetical protein